MRAHSLVRRTFEHLKRAYSHVSPRMRIAYPIGIGGHVERQAEERHQHRLPEAMHLNVAKQSHMVERAQLCHICYPPQNVGSEAHVGVSEQQPISNRSLKALLQRVCFA